MKQQLSSINYFGGKASHLGFIRPLLPRTEAYVEPFCGSASVMLNRTPSKQEAINDLNADLINFWEVLQSEPDNLIRMLTFMPYSREEYIASRDLTVYPSALERAARWYFRQSATTRGLIRYNPVNFMASRTQNDAVKYVRKVDALYQVHERIKDTHITSTSALDCIKAQDSPNTLFYLDPPYVHETRSDGSYAYEMDNDMHVELSDTLHSIDGMAAISGYESDLYNDLYSDWHKFETCLLYT